MLAHAASLQVDDVLSLSAVLNASGSNAFAQMKLDSARLALQREASGDVLQETNDSK